MNKFLVKLPENKIINSSKFVEFNELQSKQQELKPFFSKLPKIIKNYLYYNEEKII
jgi:hypothetical protein